MKKLVKILTLSCLSILLTFAAVAPVSAQESEHNDSFLNEESLVNNEVIAKMELIGKLHNELQIDSNGKLFIAKSESELVSLYALTETEVAYFNEIIDFQNSAVDIHNQKYNSGPVIAPRISISDWKIWFSAGDINTLVTATGLTAASLMAQPEIIMAALAAVGSTVPGFGTIFAVIVGAVAGAKISYTVAQAYMRGQGVYIGIEWNGIFPNFVHGYY